MKQSPNEECACVLTLAARYNRIETISAFFNGIFLVLISISIVMEAIQRLLDPPEMNTQRLLLVSFVGLVVNLVGIFAFNHGHAHGHGGHDHGHGHSHGHGHDHGHSANMEGNEGMGGWHAEEGDVSGLSGQFRLANPIVFGN